MEKISPFFEFSFRFCSYREVFQILGEREVKTSEVRSKNDCGPQVRSPLLDEENSSDLTSPFFYQFFLQ